MHGLSKSRMTLALAAAAAAAAIAWSGTPAAHASDRHPGAALNQQFAGAFTFHACPAGSDAADFCLTDVLTGELPDVGAVTGTFEVDIHKGATAADNCSPIEKHGAFTAADGSRINVDASGVICGGVASYRYAIDGGSGDHKHASGNGIWLIPPATAYTGGGGNGPEILFGTFNAG